MNKIDMVNAVYQHHGGLLRSEAFHIIELLINILRNQLVKGEEVKISNFGVFCLKKRKGRKVKNPRTGEIIEVAPHYSLIFRPSKNLIKALNS